MRTDKKDINNYDADQAKSEKQSLEKSGIALFYIKSGTFEEREDFNEHK